MAARKDLLKAQAFTTQRLVSALVDRDPDNAVPPLRRLGIATFVGVLLAVVLVAGFGVVGYLSKPTSQTWQQANTIVIDISAGAVFVFLEHPDEPDPAKQLQLHPVPNITSAKLITKNGPVVSVRTASLASAVRGQAYGIVKAPSQLPDPKDMSAFPLRVCSIPADLDQVTRQPRTRFTTLEIGVAPPAPRNDTVAAIDSAGTQYLIMNGRRYVLPKTGGGKSPLLDGAFALELRVDSWVDSLPVDPPLEALTIPGFGNPPTRPGAGNIGRIVSTGDTRFPEQLTYWVLLSDGYSRVGYLDMRLLVLRDKREPTNVPETEVKDYSSRTSLQSTLPMERPRFYNNGGSFADLNVCATYAEGREYPSITVDSASVPTVPASALPKSDQVQADRYELIVGVPGGGALVRDRESLASGGGAQLIWQNKRYGIPDAESKAALGYADKPAVAPVWGGILRRIPSGLDSGVLLSHAAAAGTPI